MREKSAENVSYALCCSTVCINLKIYVHIRSLSLFISPPPPALYTSLPLHPPPLSPCLYGKKSWCDDLEKKAKDEP